MSTHHPVRQVVDVQMLDTLNKGGFDTGPLRQHLGRTIQHATVWGGYARWWVRVDGRLAMVTVRPKPAPAPPHKTLKAVVFDSSDARPPTPAEVAAGRDLNPYASKITLTRP